MSKKKAFEGLVNLPATRASQECTTQTPFPPPPHALPLVPCVPDRAMRHRAARNRAVTERGMPGVVVCGERERASV